MIVLITGVPGSGKTLYGVGLLKGYLKEGRQVYADIDGLKLDGVLPAPDDWRECPDGSVICYDECQTKFGPDGAGRSGRDDVQEFETHRHRGIDIMLITQHPKLLHAHVRRLVGKHYHVLRLYGSQKAKVFARDAQIDVDKPSALREQDAFLWSYPVDDFTLYKSATIHTHKRHLPAWIKRSGIGIFALAVLTGFFLYNSMSFFSTGFGGSEGSEETHPEPKRQKEDNGEETALGWRVVQERGELYAAETSGCITVGEEYCRCVGHSGGLLKWEMHQCLATAKYLQGRL